jgi:hypothetical protein
MDKETLAKAVSDVRVAWETTLNELGQEGLERVASSGEWRVRDVLAHFNGWDRWQLVQLRCAFSGETPTEDELMGGIAYPPNDDLREDAMNAMFVAGTRDYSTEEIIGHWREISALRTAWVASASQAQLDASVGSDWGGGSPRILRLVAEVPSASNPVPVWQFILDQVEHQQHHLHSVREWLGL